MSAEYGDTKLTLRESTQELAINVTINAGNWNIDLPDVPTHLWQFINRGIENGSLKVEDSEFNELRAQFSAT